MNTKKEYKVQNENPKVNHGTHTKPDYLKDQEKAKQASAIKNVRDAVIKLVKSSVNTNLFYYNVLTNDRKAKDGTSIVNITISVKDEPSKKQNLSVIIYRDIKSFMITVTILSVTNNTVNVLYTNVDRYPVGKLEKFVPTIINSTQNIMINKKQYSVRTLDNSNDKSEVE